MNDLKDH